MTYERGGEQELIVNWRTNTIPARSLMITTISGVYQSVMDILEYAGIKDFDEKSRVTRPSDEELEIAFEHAKHWWQKVVEGIATYKQALEDPRRVPEFREPDMAHSLLFKPIGQIVLFKALVRALQKSDANGRASRWRRP